MWIFRFLEAFAHVSAMFGERRVDFTGAEEMGQGFVDEVFRVWPAQHSRTTVVPLGMAGPVEFMVHSGLPPASRSTE